MIFTSVLLLSLAAQTPASQAQLPGRWSIDLWMDSAGAIGPRPTERHVQGWVGFGVLDGDSTMLWPDTTHWVPVWPGTFAIDFRPFFGTRLTSSPGVTIDLSQAQANPFGVDAELRGDSVEMDFLPWVDHGGIAIDGLVRGDTITGKWYQKAYCCGSTGHVRMVRVSATPIVIARPKPPEPPPPLPRSARADIRVRIYDDASKRYLRSTYGLVLPDGSTKYAYTTDSTAAGWGQSFWLPPGSYQIEVRDFECVGETVFLRKLIHRPFQAKAGGSVDITIHFNRLKVPLSPSYANTKGVTCGDLEK